LIHLLGNPLTVFLCLQSTCLIQQALCLKMDCPTYILHSTLARSHFSFGRPRVFRSPPDKFSIRYYLLRAYNSYQKSSENISEKFTNIFRI
jgi:hypothetical protein